MSNLTKFLNFYGRFLIPFSAIGFHLRGLGRAGMPEGLEGRTILVTGATGGIGRAVALEAAKGGANVLAVGRNEAALMSLSGDAEFYSGNVSGELCDLGLAADTRALVARLAGRGEAIDAVVNNVGILNHEFRATGEGVDAMYAVNILNPYILTEGLIAAGALAPGATIVNMASGGLYNAPQNLTYMEQAEEGYNGFAAYATHKRAQIVLSDAWTRDHAGLRAYTMHPGWVETDGVKRSLPRFHRVLKRVLRTPEQGADTALWLISTRPEPVEGALWFDRKPRPAHAYASTRTPLASAGDIIAKLAADAGETGDAT